MRIVRYLRRACARLVLSEKDSPTKLIPPRFHHVHLWFLLSDFLHDMVAMITSKQVDSKIYLFKETPLLQFSFTFQIHISN